MNACHSSPLILHPSRLTCRFCMRGWSNLSVLTAARSFFLSIYVRKYSPHPPPIFCVKSFTLLASEGKNMFLNETDSRKMCEFLENNGSERKVPVYILLPPALVFLGKIILLKIIRYSIFCYILTLIMFLKVFLTNIGSRG